MSVGGAVSILICLAIIVLMVVTWWKIFTKAGKPGWASIIPIYDIFVILDIIGKPLWWIILMFIPVVSFVTDVPVCGRRLNAT